jgi:hypothetical protein
MKVSLETDFALSLAMATIMAAFLGPPVPSRRLVFLWNSGVSTTQLVGTCTVSSKAAHHGCNRRAGPERDQQRNLEGLAVEVIVMLAPLETVEVIDRMIPFSGDA